MQRYIFSTILSLLLCLLWKWWDRKHVAPGVNRRKEEWCVKGTALVPKGLVLYVSLE